MVEPLPLGNFRRGGRRFAGQLLGQRVLELPVTSTSVLFAGWGRADAVLSAAGGVEHALADVEVLSPVAPRQILQAGANYRRHVVELLVAQGETRANAEAAVDARAAAGRPYLFAGLPSSICGPYDDVVLPREGEQTDWELELAVVIGREARHVAPAAALDHVAGYTICNDITTRDRVFRPDTGALGADWVASKCAPSFLPTGPYLVPAAAVPDPMTLRITLTVNGELMQDESTADMLHDVSQLIAYASECVQLLPGDLLLTGSPAGNGVSRNRFLAPGDVIEGAISGLGVQRNRCVAPTAP